MRFKGPAGQFEVAGILGKNSCVDCGQTWRANQVFVAIIDDTVLFSCVDLGGSGTPPQFHLVLVWSVAVVS
eukprot:COSAG01_NODE_1681_length_9505_cov_149.510419_5_plen_71_part_00